MGRSNHEDAFRIQQMLLTLFGVWPIENPSLFYKIKGIISFIIMFSFATSLFLSVLFIKEYGPLIASWTFFISISNCYLKFGLFYIKVPTLVKLLKFLHSSHFHYYDEDLDVHIQSAIRISTIMVKVFLISAMCTVSSLILSPSVSPKPRQLPLPFFMDLVDQPLPFYLCVYGYESIALLTSACTTTGIDHVATSMMSLSSAYFKVLKLTIIRTTNANTLVHDGDNTNDSIYDYYEKFDKEVNDRLSLCVEHHIAVIK